jgi:hypothetical protein
MTNRLEKIMEDDKEYKADYGRPDSYELTSDSLRDIEHDGEHHAIYDGEFAFQLTTLQCAKVQKILDDGNRPYVFVFPNGEVDSIMSDADLMKKAVTSESIKHSEEIPDYSDIIPIDEFIKECEMGDFIDDDGIGELIIDDKMTGIRVCPSDIVNHSIDLAKVAKVAWFNR